MILKTEKLTMKWLESKKYQSSIEIQEAFSSSFLMCGQLAKHGITSLSQARYFLGLDPYSPASPFEFPELEQAVQRIQKVLSNGEIIGIWGDFDVDGQTSTALLVDGLRKLSAQVVYHVPVRADESHGIGIEFLKKFLAKGIQLLVTCDTGITEFESLEYLADLGIDVILTDHHTPDSHLPSAFAILNPRLLPDHHVFTPLAGVGTAYQLLRGLFEREKKPELQENFLDLVAMGTIADLADLTRENRFYAKKGLAAMNKNPRPALKAILELAGFKGKQQITESHIGFSIAPRLNASGRLADANPIIEFLVSSDETFIKKTAFQLEDLNARRKLAADMVFQSALEMLEKQPALLQYPVLVLAKSGWEGGVVGIAASRIVERFQKPAILMSITDNVAAGSARSVEGVNLIQAIRDNSEPLIRFGGHPMAAGLSINVDEIPKFRESLSNSIAAQTAGYELEPNLEIDAYLPLANLNSELLDEIDQLAPFGPGNTPPLLVSRNLEIANHSLIGKTRDHRKLTLKDSQGGLAEALWWNSADSHLPENIFDLAFYARRDEFKAMNSVVLEWVDYHQVERETIKVLPGLSKFRVIDFRLNPEEISILKDIETEKITQLWAEGYRHQFEDAAARSDLKPGKILVILTPPPSYCVLQEVLDRVSPLEIILFSFYSSDDTLKGFLDNISSLFLQTLKDTAGIANMETLAGALGHTRETVKAGLDWWNFHGDIDFTIQEDNISFKKTKNLQDPVLSEHTRFLHNLLRETSAFRNYYQRADPVYFLR